MQEIQNLSLEHGPIGMFACGGEAATIRAWSVHTFLE